MLIVRRRYESNVRGVGQDLNNRLERIVSRAARDGARAVTALSEPSVDAFGTGAKTQNGVVSARVIVSKDDWWAGIFDKGSLGQRDLPLRQPGRRRAEWKIRRRGRNYTARRSVEALRSGGIRPQYFFARAKRHAEGKLAEYLRVGR